MAWAIRVPKGIGGYREWGEESVRKGSYEVRTRIWGSMSGVGMRVYRASSLGYSLEALVAPHLGFEPVNPPEFIQKAFDEGNRIEPLAIEKLREMGWFIRTAQNEVNANGDYQIEVELEVIPGKVIVVGHLDGILHHPAEDSMVVEIKMMADQLWRAFKKHGWDAPGLVQKYKWQASAYMLATGLAHYMVAWNKDTEELHIIDTYEPFYTISDIAAKLAQAEEFIEQGLVPDGCDDFPCPFYFLHPPKDEVARVEDDELETLLAEWLLCDKQEKQFKGLKEAKRAKILALTGENAVAKVKGECGVTVETYWQKKSKYEVTKKEGWITRISGPRGK